MKQVSKCLQEWLPGAMLARFPSLVPLPLPDTRHSCSFRRRPFSPGPQALRTDGNPPLLCDFSLLLAAKKQGRECQGRRATKCSEGVLCSVFFGLSDCTSSTFRALRARWPKALLWGTFRGTFRPGASWHSCKWPPGSQLKIDYHAPQKHYLPEKALPELF